MIRKGEEDGRSLAMNKRPNKIPIAMNAHHRISESELRLAVNELGIPLSGQISRQIIPGALILLLAF